MRKYFYNPNAFQIDTPEAFYWLGFLAADGNVSDRYTISLSLKHDDFAHLEKFQKFLNTTAPVKICKRSIGGFSTNDYASLRITSKDLSGQLKKYNIVPRKTKIFKIPDHCLDNKFINDFIRGYFDGDGWFSTSNGRVSWGLSGNKEFLLQVKSIINSNCNFEENIGCLYKQKNIYKLVYSSQKQVGKICKFLWANETVSLDRKAKIAESSKILDREKFDIEKIVSLYKSLQSSHLVAKALNCSAGTVLKYCRAQSVPLARLKGHRIRQSKMLYLEKEELTRLYAKNMSIRAISRHFKRSPTTIKKYLDIYGIL